MKYTILLLTILCCTIVLKAQIATTIPIDTAQQRKHKGGGTLSIGSGGINIHHKRDSIQHTFEIQYGMLDLGINALQDNTDYQSTAARNFLRVDAARANSDLFSLRQGKSVNVNVYPIMVKAKLYRGIRQEVTLASGVGLQLYNFRFTKPVSYVTDPTPGVVMDTISFSKNKLAFSYLTVPLMINAKTRFGGEWLVYGVGISGGYLLSSWTKQISDERGKQKNHDPFNFQKTNLCVNGEIGVDGYIRLYASYQLTALHENALDQHPFSIGIRFLGL